MSVNLLRVVVASIVAAVFFLFTIAIAAFQTRDDDVRSDAGGDLSARRKPVRVADASTGGDLTDGGSDPVSGIVEMPPDLIDEVHKELSSTLPSCMEESAKLDPSVGGTLKLTATLRASSGTARLVADAYPPATSPFLRGCIQRVFAKSAWSTRMAGSRQVRIQLTSEAVQFLVVP